MIREFQKQDITQIEKIWLEASAISQSFLTPSFIETERQKLSSVYIHRTDTWVYEENNTVKGFIAMIDNEIGALFIDPLSHRQGIGSLLIDFVAMLHEALEVEVFKKNTMARAFYNKYGFNSIKEHFHEEANQELIRLRYTIA